eukprot:287510-Pyramimonas_sp.AAC.1
MNLRGDADAPMTNWAADLLLLVEGLGPHLAPLGRPSGGALWGSNWAAPGGRRLLEPTRTNPDRPNPN